MLYYKLKEGSAEERGFDFRNNVDIIKFPATGREQPCLTTSALFIYYTIYSRIGKMSPHMS